MSHEARIALPPIQGAKLNCAVIFVLVSERRGSATTLAGTS